MKYQYKARISVSGATCFMLFRETNMLTIISTAYCITFCVSTLYVYFAQVQKYIQQRHTATM